jgi:hypothetical protein
MEEKMARVLLVAVLFTIGATAQQLTVVPSTIQGVALVGPESPNFEALVTQIVGTDRPIGFAAALPYALVIRNSTSEAIAAIDTVWTTTDRILLNATDAMFNKAILYVKPGQAVVASPPGILQNQRQMQIFANGTTESHRLENFRNPGNVTVAIDAVVFESGQFVGADRYGAFEQWEAQIQAPRDLASTVLQKQGSQSIREIVSWLEGLAAIRRLPADAHSVETIFAARVLLAVYRGEGEAALYSRAKSMVDAPVFPLHR